MQRLKAFVLCAVMACSTVLSASTDSVDPPKKATVAQTVGELLKNPSFRLDKDIMATVTLVLNKHNEMVVLSVKTSDEYIESYIKNRLNYKKLSLETTGLKRYFTIPVKFREI